MKRNRPDLGTFAPGNVYRHSATGELVEFVGVAYAAPLPNDDESDGEDVAVFRPVGTPGAPITADRAGYERGETFELVHDLDRARCRGRRSDQRSARDRPGRPQRHLRPTPRARLAAGTAAGVVPPAMGDHRRPVRIRREPDPDHGRPRSVRDVPPRSRPRRGMDDGGLRHGGVPGVALGEGRAPILLNRGSRNMRRSSVDGSTDG